MTLYGLHRFGHQAHLKLPNGQSQGLLQLQGIHATVLLRSQSTVFCPGPDPLQLGCGQGGQTKLLALFGQIVEPNSAGFITSNLQQRGS